MFFRIMDSIVSTFHLANQHASCKHLPHHLRTISIKDTVNLLVTLQLSDNILIGEFILCRLIYLMSLLFLGSLSILLLHGLILFGVNHNPIPDSVCLSPSFYQPLCLHFISKFINPESQDYSSFLFLKAQLNHFDSWILLPEYNHACLNYLDSSCSKSEHIKYAQYRLKIGDIGGAILALESCKRDSWPDIYRYYLLNIGTPHRHFCCYSLFIYLFIFFYTQ